MTTQNAAFSRVQSDKWCLPTARSTSDSQATISGSSPERCRASTAQIRVAIERSNATSQAACEKVRRSR
jgi:hypothetical protein